MKAGNCDDVAWNWPYAPPKALHPWWCSNFLDLLLSSFTLKNLPALATSFFPPREKKQRLFLLSVLFLLFGFFFSPPLPEAPSFSVIPKTNSASLWSPGLSYYLPPTPTLIFFPPCFSLFFFNSWLLRDPNSLYKTKLPFTEFFLPANIISPQMSTELELSSAKLATLDRRTDRPTCLSLEAAREQRKLHGYGGWLAG